MAFYYYYPETHVKKPPPWPGAPRTGRRQAVFVLQQHVVLSPPLLGAPPHTLTRGSGRPRAARRVGQRMRGGRWAGGFGGGDSGDPLHEHAGQGGQGLHLGL